VRLASNTSFNTELHQFVENKRRLDLEMNCPRWVRETSVRPFMSVYPSDTFRCRVKTTKYIVEVSQSFLLFLWTKRFTKLWLDNPTLWRHALLASGYSYKASCIPKWVKPVVFVIFDILALWRSGLSVSVRMSKITNDVLTRSGTGCCLAVPIWQQYVGRWASKG